MNEEKGSNSEDSNSIMIRLSQIKENGKVTITHDDISVFYQFSDNTSSFAKHTTEYKRMITYDELTSLNSAIDLLKNKNKQGETNNEITKLYKDFQDSFNEAKILQNKIKILHGFGKTFVYEDDLIKDHKNISVSLEILINNYKNHINDQNQSREQPNYPPFITPDNLLYFGSLLQRKEDSNALEKQEEPNDPQSKEEPKILKSKEKEKILKILKEMFPSSKNSVIEKAVIEALKKENIFDTLKCSIHMFSKIYEGLSASIKYSKSTNEFDHSIYDNNFKELQDELLSYFYSHNFLVIKVDKPVETFHVIQFVSSLLYNDPRRIPYFYENFFCYEDSDIGSYFADFEKSTYQIQTQFSFIIHPELLSSHNQNILKEKIVSRMSPIPDMTLQKFVIITSSNDFVFGTKPDENVKNKQHFTRGDTTIKVDSSLMREYSFQGFQPYFTIKIFQSSKAGCGKTTFINQEIERIASDKRFNYHIFHHFIVDSNQRIPIESFNDTGKKSRNIIHLQFSDEIMKNGIKFWSYLYQLYTKGFVLPTNGEPLTINSLYKNLIIFEIPQLRGKNKPLQSFDDFPLPISTKFPTVIPENPDLFRDLLPIKISDTLVRPSNEFENTKIDKQYYKFGIDLVVKNLANKPKKHINNLKQYIELMYNIIFDPKGEFTASIVGLRKLGFIEKYLHKYTKLYINSISSIENNVNEKEFIAFFYLLTVSAFYVYDCLPKESIIDKKTKIKYFIGYGLTFLTVNDLFCDHVKSSDKKITFFTTKSFPELFKKLDKPDSYKVSKFKYFSVEFKYSEQDSKKDPRDVLRRMFCSSEEYKNIVLRFKEKNPQSYISRTQMTIPTLFRSSILLSRIFLSQPIIMSGDTGCGKTSSLMLLYEYIKLPINNRMYSLSIEVGNTLNCHGGVVTEDVINHLKNAPRSSKKHIIFFDELNTSPASSYIEHLLLNENNKFNSKFVFIGALNPWKKKNPISSNLTKVGLMQFIKGEEKTVNLIEKATNDEDKRSDNMSDMMYHVHRPQEATQDIIFDFNPICYQEKYTEEDKFYPNEEKRSIHLIIKNVSKNKDLAVIQNLCKYIDECITFIRILMNERAVISYRDIERTMIMYNELYDYNNKLNKAVEEHLPIITSIISFVLRLPNHQEFKEKDLNPECSKIFKSVFDRYFNKGNYGKLEDGKYTINSRDKLLSELAKAGSIKSVDEVKKIFMTFVYQYTLSYLNDDSIWKFQATFIHIFIMDICIRCKLPCFIIGMPGTSKSYAVELLKQHYGDKLYVSTYMSSRTSSPDGIKSQYYDATYKEISNENNDCFCVVFIDEMGNANINPSRPLKFLHGILDHGLVLNETGYSNKVATIGVSNYTMDFANMNRGVLVYTGLPDREEILRVFALDEEIKKPKITNSVSFIDHKANIDTTKIAEIFKNLWGKNMPETIALRSIYNVRNLIDKDSYDIHSLCRILRELFNSKRLADVKGEKYANLMAQCPPNVRKSCTKYSSIDNMACFLERICCISTYSNKSLSLFTKNYEAIEYFDLFLDDKFIESIGSQFADLRLDKGRFANFKYLLFAEDFKRKPEQLSQEALTNIIECISEDNQNILFIGNHPCFDACLDLLNVPHDSEQLQREVTLGSGFSSKFMLTNTKFYIMMIANIDELKNISSSENPFSFAFLDRTETIYLDWNIIGPYYIKYKNPKVEENQISGILENMTKTLTKNAQYETKIPHELHSNIEKLYTCCNEINFGDNYLNELIKSRWANGIKAVILTKSKILEDIYLPPKIPKENRIIENDTNIQDFAQLNKSIEKVLIVKESLIIINCSSFDELHFAHLKTFLDHIQTSNPNNKLNILIIFYGIDINKHPKIYELSTFRWPILAMEDISIHPELEDEVVVKKTKKESGSNKESQIVIEKKTTRLQITNDEVDKIITKLNNMDKDEDSEITKRCNFFFSNILDNIITFIEKDIRERAHNNKLNIKENYEKSDFRIYVDFFKQVKEKFEITGNKKYFNIKIDNNNFISSRKSQIISQVYRVLCDILQPFLVFRFGSQIHSKTQSKTGDQPTKSETGKQQPKSETGESDLDDFILKCPYLDISLRDFIKYSGSNPYDYLFLEFYKFLINNSVQFDETMKKQKLIADRVLTAIGQIKEVPKTFEIIFGTHFSESFGANYEKFIEYIIEFRPTFADEDKGLILVQTIADFYRFRSIAGINIASHQIKNTYWNKYMTNSIILREKKKVAHANSKAKNLCNRGTLIKSITEFNNKSIFDIFVSPVIVDEGKLEASICRKLTSSNEFKINLEENDKIYQIYKAFNEDLNSLKNESRYNLIKQKIEKGILTRDNKHIAISMLLFYATNKFDAVKQETILTILNIIKDFNNADLGTLVHVERDFKISKCVLSLPKFKSFGEIWETNYEKTEWSFKGDCLIDEIQSIINCGSNVKPKFRKWLCCGFENDEPLAVVAFRRFLNSQDDKKKNNETKNDLAKVLDPFFGNKKIVDLFIDSIGGRIKDDSPFPFNEITTDDEFIMKQISFKSIFKFSTEEDKNTLFRLNAENPLLSQVIWFHVAFNRPSKYPLMTLLIKDSPFFIDFQVVPKIINTLVHIRHIFSYNPVYIPIILHCTSLFKNCDCKLLLYSLNYFNTKYVKNAEDDSETIAVIKEFENIQTEIDSFEKFIKTNYSKSYERIRHQSSYYQIGFILDVYFEKYNSIIKKIKNYSKKYHDNKKEIEKLETIEVSSILPNMLVTNLTLSNILLPLMYEKRLTRFSDIEKEMCKIFEDTDCFKAPSNDSYAIDSIFPLFTVKIDKSKDYIGYTEDDYKKLFLNYVQIDNNRLQPVKLNGENNSLNFHASVLSYFLHIYLNKSDDDLSPYIEVKKKLNDLSTTHLNTYAHYIHYDLQIKAKNLVLDKENSKFDKSVKLFFEANSSYPNQSIFKLLPVSLINEIRRFQDSNKDGLKIIESEQPHIEEEEEMVDDDDDI